MLLAKHVQEPGQASGRRRQRDGPGINVGLRWIGNVRGLDNALERGMILSEGPILTPDDFPPGLIVDSEEAAMPATIYAPAVREYERHHIQRVLRECADDKREAARRLGLGLSSLYRKLEELGIRL